MNSNLVREPAEEEIFIVDWSSLMLGRQSKPSSVTRSRFKVRKEY